MTKAHLPDVMVRIDAVSNEELADYISSRRGSYALSFYDPKHPLVKAEKILEGNMVCVLPMGHPLAEKSQVDIQDFENENMILYHSDTAHGRLAIQLFAQANIRLNTTVSVRYNDVACAMVEQGLGASLVSNFVTMNNSFPKLLIVPLAQETKLEVFILRHTEVALSHISRSYFQHLKSALQEAASIL